MEWTREEYARRLKEAFQRADRSGAGVITPKELVDIFQDLDQGAWSDEELAELIGAVDKDGAGLVRYGDFIAYVMETPPPEDEAEAEREDEELDGGAGELLEREPELRQAPPELDAEQWISCDQWVLIMRQLVDEDDREARAGYAQLRERLPASAEGISVRQLLEELQVKADDHDALRAVAGTVKAAALAVRSEDWQRRPRAVMESLGLPESPTLRRAVHQVVRSLYLARRPFEDATEILSQGLVPLSQAECLAIQDVGREPGRLVEQAQAFARDPPMLSAMAGLRACHELCCKEVSEIIAECQAAGKKFVDASWDLATSPAAALYVDGQRPGHGCTVGRPMGVRRLAEIVATSAVAPALALSALYGGAPGAAAGPTRAAGAPRAAPRPVLVKDGSRVCEIVQGQIGTCYLLGAMGAVASNSADAIRSLFVKYDIDMGVYGVRFNVDGEWTYVIIDDQMPVDENGELLYARSVDPAEVWCPLLEKAFCKLHTCYEMCDGGQTSEAVAALTGGIGGRLRIAACHREEPGRYFRVLRQARAHGWLLSADFLPAAAGAAAGCAARARGKCGEAALPGGLIAGHTYSVLKIVEAHGHQLVCLRNPWGSGEWTDKWSNRNAEGEWTAAMKKATGFVGADDGLFWMSIEDFVARSAGVDYARTFGPDWRKVSQYARFRRGELLATARCAYAAADEDEISFASGDQVQVTALCGSFWWRGRVWRVRVPGTATTKEGFFPAGRVQVNDHPIVRFDLSCAPSKTTAAPMIAVVTLSQPNAMLQRRFFKRREDGLTCKDVSYPRLQLCIVGPSGEVIARRAGRRRCLWVELELPGSGCWRIYALSLDGLGSAFSVRVYAKGGDVSLKEVPGATVAEVGEGTATAA